MTGIELRQAVKQAKQDFSLGKISEAQLFAAVDAYIQAIQAAEKKLRGKARKYSRSYILRNVN